MPRCTQYAQFSNWRLDSVTKSWALGSPQELGSAPKNQTQCMYTGKESIHTLGGGGVVP